jgi:hypothetical protein
MRLLLSLSSVKLSISFKTGISRILLCAAEIFVSFRRVQTEEMFSTEL